LKECEEDIKKALDQVPLYIDFDQLEVMGTQTKSRVLFTRPHLTNSGKLKDLIDVLLTKFIDNNLIPEDIQKSSHIYYNDSTERWEIEKPHVTLMNSTFLLREQIKASKEGQKINNEKTYFNGMKIIKRMKNFSFGIHKIEEFTLNEMRIDNDTNTYKVKETYKI
jgi:hypothetical protein